jgi:hypothetical protein
MASIILGSSRKNVAIFAVEESSRKLHLPQESRSAQTGIKVRFIGILGPRIETLPFR